MAMVRVALATALLLCFGAGMAMGTGELEELEELDPVLLPSRVQVDTSDAGVGGALEAMEAHPSFDEMKALAAKFAHGARKRSLGEDAALRHMAVPQLDENGQSPITKAEVKAEQRSAQKAASAKARQQHGGARNITKAPRLPRPRFTVTSAGKTLENVPKDVPRFAQVGMRPAKYSNVTQLYYTTDGSKPSVKSKKVGKHTKITLDGSQDEVIVRTLAVARLQNKTASAESNATFTVLPLRWRQAKREFSVVVEKGQEAMETAAKVPPFEKIAKTKQLKAEATFRISHKTVKQARNIESDAVSNAITSAKLAKNRYLDALAEYEDAAKKEGKKEKAHRVAKEKHVEAIDAEVNAREDFDTSLGFLRTSEWSGHIEKRESAHRFRRAEDDKKIAKIQLDYTNYRADRQKGDHRKLEKATKTAIATADAALASEEAADGDRKFQAKVTEKLKKAEADKQDEILKVSARKEKAAAKESADAAEKVAAAGDDPGSALSAADEAVEGSKLATQKAAAQEAAMKQAAEAKEMEAADMKQAMEHWEGPVKDAARKAIAQEKSARNESYTETMKYMEARDEAEATEKTLDQLRVRLKGETLIQAQAKETKGFVMTWYNITAAERDIAKHEFDVAEKTAFAWAYELQKWSKITQLAEDDEAQFRRDKLATLAAKRQLEVITMQAEATRRQAWRHTYHVQTSSMKLEKRKAALLSEADKRDAKALKAKADGTAQVVNAKQHANKKAKELRQADEDQANQEAMEKEQAKDIKMSKKLGNTQDVAADEARIAKEKNEVNTDKKVEKEEEAAVGKASTSVAEAKLMQDLDHKQGSAEKSVALKIRAYVAKMGNITALVTGARQKAEAANSFMKQVEAFRPVLDKLVLEAEREHTIKYKDMVNKQSEKRRVRTELGDAMKYHGLKRRYLARAESVKLEWSMRRKHVIAYERDCHQTWMDTVIAMAKAERKKKVTRAAEKKQLAVMKAAFKKVDDMLASVLKRVMAGCKPPADNYIKNPAFFMKLHTDLRNMEKECAVKRLTDGKRRLDEAVEEARRARPPYRRASLAEKIEKKANKFVIGEQDSIIQAGVAQNKNLDARKVVMRKEKMTRWKEIKVAADALDKQRAITRREKATVKKLEELRRAKALAALSLRVSELWRRRSSDHDPRPQHKIASSRYHRLLAAWDRDGSPLGPGAMDSWNIKGESTGLLFEHEGRSGFLHQKVVTSCSNACLMQSDPVCSRGRIADRCTRGRVFRARFEYTDNTAAKNDFFVCRCNSGILQFASEERLTSVRVKNKLMTTRLSPEGIIFKRFLHDAERIPEHHIKCFAGFKDWMGSKVGFAPTLEGLEAQLKTPANAMYLMARQQWYETCMKEKDSFQVASANPKKFPGSTDSSFDIFMLTQAQRDAATKADALAKVKAKKQQQDALRDAKARAEKATAIEKKDTPSIAVGDKSQSKAAAAMKIKDGSAFVQPTPEEIAVKKAQAEEKEKVKKDPKARLEQEAAEAEALQQADELKAENSATLKSIDKAIDDKTAKAQFVSNATVSNTTNATAANATNTAAANNTALPRAVAPVTKCWKARPGATFVFHEVKCQGSAAANLRRKQRDWGAEVRGLRRPEGEGAKLMSVVGPYGCTDYLQIGGDKESYWGQLGAEQRPLPCGPSGNATYLSPKGAAVKYSIDLIRKAEFEEEKAQARALAAASKGSGDNTSPTQALAEIERAQRA